jgi:hypothetical protein
MNYYDELGVSRDAPVQEIRQAYRVLVRLLHPDAQSEGELKLAAERQLNRLNAMIAILSTPELRRAYDLQLGLESCRRLVPAPPEAVSEFARREDNGTNLVARAKPLIRLVFQYWSFILIGAVTCGATLASLLLHNPSETLPESRNMEAVRSASVAAPKARPATQLPQRQAQMTAQDSQAEPAEGVAFQVESPPFRIRPTVMAKSTVNTLHPMRIPLPAGSQPLVTAVPPEPASKTASPPAAIASSSSDPFAGNWFYAVDLDTSQASDGYRAVYVELLLSERGETLSGNYRARYLIPDKAISPEVSFHLEGKVGPGRSARVPWTAANGARGEAELNVNASGVMDFHWWSTEIPEKAGLSSGNAKLVRQRVP